MRNNTILKFTTFILIFLVFLNIHIDIDASVQPITNAYTYSTVYGEVKSIVSPMPFVPGEVIYLNTLEEPVQRPADMCFDNDGNLLIIDNVGNKIVIVDENYQFVRILDNFERNGEIENFNSPTGAFVTKNGDIYICDTGNSRIVILNDLFELKKIIETPESELLGADYIFNPLKITVDLSGNMYVINRNEYNGIMQIDGNGIFVNFIGSNKVVFNPVVAFWKSIMTPEQEEKIIQFIPIEYTNLSMDNEGFIYAVSAAKDEKIPVRRLNLTGEDILLRNGYVDVIGDIDTINVNSALTVKSAFIDVASSISGIYYVLDAAQGRIFAYNQDGFLLYVFAGIGNEDGLFRAPLAIEFRENNLLVMDQTNNSITVFTATNYSSKISSADTLFLNGEYEESHEVWNEVLNMNSNFELAYARIGSIFLEQGKYRESMEYFKLGNFRGDNITNIDGYNKAYNEYRKQYANDNMHIILFSIILLAVLYTLLKKWINKKNNSPIVSTQKKHKIILRDFLYIFYVIFHPINGFYEMKTEKKGKIHIALLGVFLVSFTNIFRHQFSSFLFNRQYFQNPDLLYYIMQIFVVFILFCVGNWSITTLLDGEGTFLDIVQVFGYSCYPIVIIQVPLIVLTNIATFSEMPLFQVVSALSIIWCIGLIFLGVMTVHQYSVLKMFVTTILTAVAMIVLVFIYLLFFYFVSQISLFVVSVYKEISIRLL